MVRSFAALSAIDPGFDPSPVLTFRVAPGDAHYPGGEDVARFYDTLLEKIRAIPGVTSAGAASFLAMTGGIGGLGGPFLGTEIEDAPLPPGARAPNSVFRLILGDGLRMDALGIAAGLAASLGFGRALSSLLYGVSPYDGVTLALGAIVFAAVGVLASAIPVLRAVRIPPAAALRGD